MIKQLPAGDLRRRACSTLTLGLGLFALTGCGQRLTDANLDEVVPDMSKKEVESILGQPSAIKTHELTLQTQMKTLTATRYYYDQAGQKVELIFVADKLVGKNGHFTVDGMQVTRVAEKANAEQPIPGLDPEQLIMTGSPVRSDSAPSPESAEPAAVVESALPQMEDLPEIPAPQAPDPSEDNP